MVISLVVTVRDKCGNFVADRAFCNNNEVARYADRWRVLGYVTRIDLISGAMPGSGHGLELPEVPEDVSEFF